MLHSHNNCKRTVVLFILCIYIVHIIYLCYIYICRVIRPSVDNFEKRLCGSYRVIFKSFSVYILVSIMVNSFLCFADLINPQ